MTGLQSAKGTRTRTSVFRGRGTLPRRPAWQSRFIEGHQDRRAHSRRDLARLISMVRAGMEMVMSLSFLALHHLQLAVYTSSKQAFPAGGTAVGGVWLS